MSQTILLFTEKITNRIHYIFDFILCDFSGIDYKTTTDFNEFKQSDLPKINFSNQFLDEEIKLEVDDILIENEIRSSINYNSLHEVGKCFYWLSRYEEYNSPQENFDKHYRFLGSDLDYSQPIVDIICYEIQAKIKAKYPELNFRQRIFKQINTHDIDYAWKYLHHSQKIKFGSLGKKLLKRNLAEFKQQFNVLNRKQKDPYDTYYYLKNLAQKHQIETIFFWLLGDYSTFDKNHNWENKAQQKLIKEISTWAKIGIHPSYQSNNDNTLLTTEINRLQIITNYDIKLSRQHFIKSHLPITYQQLLINQISEDYTMGFAHKIGFRAGTSTPYKWFDLTTNQQTLLTIYPFTAMDVTLKNYLKLTPEEAIQELKSLKQTIKNVNGTFITLFHQSNLNEEWLEWRKVYESIFND